ncbi:hypothetical protein BDQ17DRAFT_1354496 [Cyathus striatus]|nr:hypothetical protein BDQ17DRAFT_1354496 [Cyathus striatus]
MAGRLIIGASLAPLALAFHDTHPVIAWSSSSSGALESLPSNLPTSVDVPLLLQSILNQDDVCEHDAVVLIQQPGLHASDLRTISPHSQLSKILSSSSSARQFPYVQTHGPSVVIQEFADELVSYCGSRLLSYSLGDKGVSFESGTKHVIRMDIPHLHESRLGHEISAIESAFPDHLVVLMGSAGATFEHSISSRQVFDHVDDTAANVTLPEGGILKRYQILTPALITGFLVTFFILIPILLFGIKALASIQSPLRMDAPKGFSAQEKKNQ